MGEDEPPSLVSMTSIVSGVVVGLAHAGVAASLWNYWYDDLWVMLAIKPLNGLYIGLGMFLLGFVPALFYAGRKVVSPAIIVGILLVLSGLGSWLSGPILAPSSTPTLFGLYVLFWVGIVVLAGVTGGWEVSRRHRATD